MDAEQLKAVATVIVAIGSVLGPIISYLNNRKLGKVHTEVKTANGISIGALADRAEGRRVIETVLKADRTTSEQGYVDNLAKGGRDPGHDGNPKLNPTK